MTEETKMNFSPIQLPCFSGKGRKQNIFYMENGLIQTIGTLNKELSTTEFKSVSIDLSDAIIKEIILPIYHMFRLGY